MADFKHKTVGTQLTQAEFEDTVLHEIDGLTAGGVLVISNPPSGYYKVVNLYCEKVGASYKLVVVHEDTPQP